MTQPIVFMYHAIIVDAADVPSSREVGAELYDVRLEDFHRQMEILKNEGARVTTLEDENPGDGKRVILTFDDGERNNFKNAFPVLRQFGWPAYFFATAHHVGTKGFMAWEELMELRDAGMIVGSHGLSHQILTTLSDTKLEKELMESKDILERHLKINVENFSVPRGFVNEKVLRVARDAGYKNIFVSEARPAFIELPLNKQNSKSSHAVETAMERFGVGNGKLNKGCWGRVAVKGGWTAGRFKMALAGETPLAEHVSSAGKTFMKQVLGAKAYDAIRRIFLK